ncbi:HK97 family phage major capsid protein [Microvirga lupini]|uniref:HK97 family phage major capsid protein n=1 Tax=Microvirga lupini TaxID=420324 RepID=A0A7W4YZ42_9HYPH|nr:phage major capsid protein [Microvirga lupini]MBB3020663.1 HK97 family phage major capsid protein [Microvirga lupini]
MDRLATLTSQYELNAKAQAFVRYTIARAVGYEAGMDTAEVFEKRWPNSKYISMVQKAAVPAGSTGNWGDPLVPVQGFATEFLELVRPLTILGRMRGFRPVPFRVKFNKQTSGATAGWVGEFKPIPVGKLDMSVDDFEHSKVAGIIVLTKELVRSSDPAAEAVVMRDLVGGIAQFTDEQLLDPTVTETGIRPASITNGLTAIPSTDPEADLYALTGALSAAGAQFLAPYFIMSPKNALALAALRNSQGASVFPNVNVLGGDIWGIPVLVSANAGDQITLLDAAELMLADGAVELDIAQEAALQMRDDPVDGAVQMVSLFQANSVGFRGIRTIRWKMRNPGAVAYVSGTSY